MWADQSVQEERRASGACMVHAAPTRAWQACHRPSKLLSCVFCNPATQGVNVLQTLAKMAAAMASALGSECHSALAVAIQGRTAEERRWPAAEATPQATLRAGPTLIPEGKRLPFTVTISFCNRCAGGTPGIQMDWKKTNPAFILGE